MSGYVEMARVLRNEQIGADVWIMDLYAPKQAAEAEVGQFCNVRVTGGTAPLLRRPISMPVLIKLKAPLRSCIA